MKKPIADFSAWFSGNAVSRVLTEKERQDWKLGLIYETFRRHPEVLRAKLQKFRASQPGWNPSEYRKTPWLNSPWNAAAFQFWSKPWNKFKKRERDRLIYWTAAGVKGPRGVSMSVSKLLPDGSSEVCKYIPLKTPLTMTVNVERILIETDPELKKHGWKLFAIDCRSKDAVKRAAMWIIKNHAVKGGHGKAQLTSWIKRLAAWNEQFLPAPKHRVTITKKNLRDMKRAWKKTGLNKLARKFSS